MRSRCGTRTRQGMRLPPASFNEVEGLLEDRLWCAVGTVDYRELSCVAEVS